MTSPESACVRPAPDSPSTRSLPSLDPRALQDDETRKERDGNGSREREETHERRDSGEKASSVLVLLDGYQRRTTVNDKAFKEGDTKGDEMRERNGAKKDREHERGRADNRHREREHTTEKGRAGRRDDERRRDREREKGRGRVRDDRRHDDRRRDDHHRKEEHRRRHDRPPADYPPSKRSRHGRSRSPPRRSHSRDRHSRSQSRRSRSRSPQLYRKQRTWGSIYEYELVGSINEGSFGTVFHALNKNKVHVAVKRLKLSEHDEKVGIYEREIDALEQCEHENIITLIELCTNQKNEKFLVLEYCRYDLRKLLRIHPRLDTALIKSFVLQILRGLEYLHSKHIIHRDLKSENLLINDAGVLKLGDLGSCRSWRPSGSFSPNMVTLRYRALELFLGAKRYSTAVDMWSLGCIVAELYAGTGKPFLDGTSELEQIDKMCEVLGSPNEKKWPGLNKLDISRKLTFPNQPLNKLRHFIPSLDDEGFFFVSLLLRYNPETRISAKDALAHAYFKTEPLPAPVGSLPENILADIEQKNAILEY